MDEQLVHAFSCLASDSSSKLLSCNPCTLIQTPAWHRLTLVSVFLVSIPGMLSLLIFHSHREACLFKGFSAQHINSFFFFFLTSNYFYFLLNLAGEIDILCYPANDSFTHFVLSTVVQCLLPSY